MAQVHIRWTKSTIGYNQRQRDTIRSLGLRRMQATVVHEDSPALRGMLHSVRHLVEVIEAPAESTGGDR